MSTPNRMRFERSEKEREDQWLTHPAPAKLTLSDTELTAVSSLQLHWPEYLMEVGEVIIYMLFACGFATLLRHHASPVQNFILGSSSRWVLMGLAMGATVIAIVMSPGSKQSEGHFNPAITFIFYRLGKVMSWDASFYIAGQFLGAIGGVALEAHRVMTRCGMQ